MCILQSDQIRPVTCPPPVSLHPQLWLTGAVCGPADAGDVCELRPPHVVGLLRLRHRRDPQPHLHCRDLRRVRRDVYVADAPHTRGPLPVLHRHLCVLTQPLRPADLSICPTCLTSSLSAESALQIPGQCCTTWSAMQECLALNVDGLSGRLRPPAGWHSTHIDWVVWGRETADGPAVDGRRVTTEGKRPPLGDWLASELAQSGATVVVLGTT